MSEGDAPPAAFAFPTARRCAPRRRVVLLRRAFQPLADPDHPDRTPCPPNSSVRRTGFGVASGRTLQTTAPADDPLFRRSAPMRVAGSQPPCRRRDDGLDLSREYAGDAATGLLRKGLSPMARNDGGARGSGSGLNRASGLRRPVRGIAAFIQAAPAARPASCAPQPHCECPGRHRAAWRSSPPHCGWSPPCHAAYRRRRTAIRSRQGAGR